MLIFVVIIILLIFLHGSGWHYYHIGPAFLDPNHYLIGHVGLLLKELINLVKGHLKRFSYITDLLHNSLIAPHFQYMTDGQ